MVIPDRQRFVPRFNTSSHDGVTQRKSPTLEAGSALGDFLRMTLSCGGAEIWHWPSLLTKKIFVAPVFILMGLSACHPPISIPRLISFLHTAFPSPFLWTIQIANPVASESIPTLLGMCSGKKKTSKRDCMWLLNVMLLISGCRYKGRNKTKKSKWHCCVCISCGSKTMQFGCHCWVVSCAVDFWWPVFSLVLSGGYKCLL